MAILKDAVDSRMLWREIARNLESFTSDIKFDGNFVVPALVSKQGGGEADFLNRGIESFASTVREIRNALSHGKDQKTSDVILPTVRNFERLQPWVSLMCVAAGQVMLYRHVN